jgi:hypothetical protein
VKPEQMEYAAPGPGQCIVHNMDGALFVERADPVVAIPEALVTQIRAGQGRQGMSLDGKTLVIAASNQTVSYRLTRCTQPGYLLGMLT